MSIFIQEQLFACLIQDHLAVKEKTSVCALCYQAFQEKLEGPFQLLYYLLMPVPKVRELFTRSPQHDRCLMLVTNTLFPLLNWCGL